MIKAPLPEEFTVTLKVKERDTRPDLSALPEGYLHTVNSGVNIEAIAWVQTALGEYL